MNHAKPTAVISAPKRLCGRRSHAKMPVAQKLRPMNGPMIAVKTSSGSWFEETTSATMTAARATAAAKSAKSAARSELMASPDQVGQRGSGQLSLGDESPGAAAVHERAEVRAVATRRQHDG